MCLALIFYTRYKIWAYQLLLKRDLCENIFEWNWLKISLIGHDSRCLVFDNNALPNQDMKIMLNQFSFRASFVILNLIVEEALYRFECLWLLLSRVGAWGAQWNSVYLSRKVVDRVKSWYRCT